MVRKTIFWIHLVCGVAAGLVILMMSVTGVLLTYERQILAAAGPSVSVPASGTALTADAIVAAAEHEETDFSVSSITLAADPERPATVSAGRGNVRLVDPYTGRVLGTGEGRLDAFFGAVTGWHRWFNAPGSSRGPWRAITGASNLVFLFLIVSGLYLWLPRIFRWAMFRARLVFVPLSAPGKARDFNWHHVLGIWGAVPLLVIVMTAAVFYYSWANTLLYRSFGELPPGRTPPPAAVASVTAGSATAAVTRPDPGFAVASRLTLDELLAASRQQVVDWQTITLPTDLDDASQARITIDRGNGGQPQHRHTLLLNGLTGDVVDWQPFQSQSPGRRARSWARFLHTGEALGPIGQTVAGLVSLTTIVMVWTGLALAFRRLVLPLFQRRRLPA